LLTRESLVIFLIGTQESIFLVRTVNNNKKLENIFWEKEGEFEHLNGRVISIGKDKVKLRNIIYVLNDFYEDNHSQISYRELQEIYRVRNRPETILRSSLFERIKPYTLPFLVQEKHLNTKNSLNNHENQDETQENRKTGKTKAKNDKP
jgi:hypothetical protein